MISAAVAVASATIGFYGAWLISESEPGRIADERLSRVRRRIRIALAIGLVGVVIGEADEVLSFPHGVRVAIQIGSGVCALAAAAGEFYKYRLYHNFASRLPNARMARRAVVLGRAYVCSFLAMVVVGAMTWFMVSSGNHRMSVVMVGAAMSVVGIGTIIIGWMTLRLLIKLNREMKLQLALARQAWDSSPERMAA